MPKLSQEDSFEFFDLWADKNTRQETFPNQTLGDAFINFAATKNIKIERDEKVFNSEDPLALSFWITEQVDWSPMENVGPNFTNSYED